MPPPGFRAATGFAAFDPCSLLFVPLVMARFRFEFTQIAARRLLSAGKVTSTNLS